MTADRNEQPIGVPRDRAVKAFARAAICLIALLSPLAARAQPPATQPAAPATQLTPERHQRLAEAESLTHQVVQLYNQGKHAEALPLAQRCLDIRRDILGEQDPLYAQSVHNVAAQYAGLGKYADAETLYRQALKIKLQVLGERHPHYGLTLNMLIFVLYKQEKYTEALPLAQHLVDIRKEVLGETHPDYALSLFNLAAQYEKLHDFAKAEPLYLKALEVRKHVYGETHPNYAAHLREMAGIYVRVGQPEKGDPLSRQANDIMKHAQPAAAKGNVPQAAAPRPDHSVGKQITAFKATKMDGSPVNFPGDYKGKIVMLDFWATWCGPCMGEVPKLVKAYNDFHPKGLEILGISLDRAEPAGEVEDVTTDKGMVWSQVYDGKYWKAEIAILYGIQSIPSAFLVDGDTGEILASGGSLRGENLAKTFESALADKAARDRKRPNPATQPAPTSAAQPPSVTAAPTRAPTVPDSPAHIQSPATQPAGVATDRTPEQQKRLAEAELLNHRVVQLYDQGKYAEALPLAERCLAIRREVLGEHDPLYAQGLHNLAAQYDGLYDYQKAEPLYRQAIEIKRQTLGQTHPDYLASLNQLSKLYDKMGDYPFADICSVQATEIKKRAFLDRLSPDQKRRLLDTYALTRHVVRLFIVGMHREALPLAERCVEIRREILGEQDPDYAESLGNLAAQYEKLGDYAKAEPLYRQAVQIIAEALGEKHPDYALSLKDLGSLYSQTGDYAKAEALLGQAVEIERQALGEKHPDYALSLKELGSLYSKTGDYPKAETLLRQAMEIERQALGEEHPAYADSLSNLACLYDAVGNSAKAEALFQRALEIRRQALGQKDPEYARSLLNLAIVVYSTGDNVRPVPLCLEAQSIMRRQLERTATVESERQQLGNEKMSQRYLDELLAVSKYFTMAGSVYAAATQWKGVVSMRQSEMRSLRTIAEGDVLPIPERERASSLCRELESSARRLAMLTGEVAGRAADTPQRPAEIASLSDRIEHRQADLAKISESYRKSRQRGHHTPEEMAQLLPVGTALIDVFEYSQYSHRSPQNRLVGFILKRDVEARRVELGVSAPIDEAVEAWRQGSFGQTDAGQEAGARLRKLLWEPLAVKLGGATTVLISPDGPLSRLPLGALPGSGPGKYLIEEISIATVPIPQALPELLAEKASDDGSPSLLLVGDVDYGSAALPIALAVPMTAPASQPADAFASAVFVSRSAARGPGSQTWPALQGTRLEMESVKESFQHRWPTGQLIALRGSAATEQAVREAAAKSRYLHLATHGFFAPPQVKSALSPTTRPASFGLEMNDPFGRMGVVGFHPGLLSGIVLAGANAPAQSGQDDGILTALEVQELDLSGVEMAVLSACETGLGQTAGGEGLLGLQRAFQVAGAKTVVASLWKVPDAETRQLMARFYDNLWVKKMPRLQALREAQLWMLNEGAAMGWEKDRGLGAPTAAPSAMSRGRMPPYFWAGFVLSGDWR